MDEGVNLPHLSAYIDLNPHISVKQIVHRIGRVLRPELNKLKADIFILSSYRNSEQVKELIDNVEQIRKAGERSPVSDKIFSLSRERLKDLSDESYSFFLRQEEFWLSVKKSFPETLREASRIAQEKGITKVEEYRANYKRLRLPSNPDQFYKEEWQSWGHFLGTGKDYPETLREASRIAQEKGITKVEEYQANYKRLRLPSNPDRFYKEEWQSWGHFLGTGRTIGTRKDYPETLREASRIAQEKGITKVEEYQANYKRLRLPSNPDRFYKEEWQSWGHFLGTGKDYPETLREASRIAQEKGITKVEEYRANYKRLRLPSNPDRFYKEEWQSWGHFLGTGRTIGTRKDYHETLREASRIAQEKGITTMREYRANYKRLRLPFNPNQFYKEEWQSWGHFLGTGRTRRTN